ncbi:ABC transporter permease [Blautia coccoides]|uniref:FtsX-like permease family protein n=1 Tax=Blautia hominis TaxID=2025493 RepID=A0ABQ0BKK8_9FIRM|nr:ABC transporter permease [Blautia coccoides]MCQ4640872.1 ABC transporter permease [Blautia coccoides]
MIWPFENDTRAITKKLAKNSLKSGKMRNILIVLTISLSIALMSGLALYISSMQTANTRQLENLQQVFFYDITEQQCDTLRRDNRISEMRVTKYGKRSEIENYVIWPMYIEQSEGKIQGAEIAEGQYPMAENEVAVDVSYLVRIGENLKIGDTVSFSFYDGAQESFVLSGLTDTGSTSDVYPIYFSEQYAKMGSQLKDTLFVAAAQIYDAPSMTADEFLDTIHAIGADCNIDRSSIGENSAFVQSLTFNPKNMLIALCIGFVVLFAGVIVIYSIFYISIINRIQYFGQLRTIGTTGKQIKRIVKREGTLLFGMGAPLGLVVGSIFAWILNAEGWSWINFLILGGLIILAEYIAVLYSISKPAQIASKVSPIEAYKAKGVLQSCKTTKRQTRKLTPFSMAKMNTSRNRKKFLMTSFSLAISGIIFMVGSTFLTSFNQEAYARNGIMEHGEVRVYLSENAAQVNEQGYAGVQVNNPLNDTFIREVSQVSGVKGIISFEKLYCTFEYNDRRDEDFIVPFTEEEFTHLSRYMETEDKNYSDIVENREIFVLKNDAVEEIYGWKFQPGDTIRFEWFDGTEYHEDTFSIGGEITSEKAYSDPECFTALGVSGWFLMPDELVRAMLPKGYNINSEVLLSTEWDSKEAEITQQLNTIIASSDDLQMRTLRDSINSKAGMYNTLLTSIIGISIFIMMFSLISLINTLVTNIMTRKQELSVLQSIGMTKRQLDHMVQCEAGLIAVWNIIITLLAGGFLGVMLIRGLNSIGMSYLHWDYPVWFALFYTVIVLIMPAVITKAAIYLLQRKSIVERLREIE